MGLTNSKDASLTGHHALPPLPAQAEYTGFLIINADDWGIDSRTTDRAFECVARGAVTSVSAMVFMEDSERAAVIARERGIDAGLHINFTTPFSATRCPPRLLEHQRRVARYLLWHRFSQIVFQPGLIRSFEYVVEAQLNEFRRLYGCDPYRLDGHHHMHLCANVLFSDLLPRGTIVRRNFSFQPGEKGLWNRLYRRLVDRVLSRRHHLTHSFFSLAPVESLSRLKQIIALARHFVVEVETHPVQLAEYQFLMEGKLLNLAHGIRMLPHSTVQVNDSLRQ